MNSDLVFHLVEVVPHVSGLVLGVLDLVEAGREPCQERDLI